MRDNLRDDLFKTGVTKIQLQFPFRTAEQEAEKAKLRQRSKRRVQDVSLLINW